MEKEKRNPTVPKASTSDILGKTLGDWQVDPKWERQYQLLSELRSSVVSRRKNLVKIAAEEMSEPAQNLEEAGTDHYDRDFALGMASSEQEILYEIDHAMNRIKSGNYGVCEMTGKPIKPDRLEAVPWARFSAEAERMLEGEGKVRRTRLGELETIPKEQLPVEEPVES
jgi:RNA polymerase-binding transcription factor DksA